MFEPRLSKEPMDIDLLYTYYFLFLFIVLLTGQLHNVMQEYIPVVKEIVIPIPERKIKKRKLFAFLDEEEEAYGE